MLVEGQDRIEETSAIGQVVAVRGSHVELGVQRPSAETASRATVGCFIGIRTGRSFLIGMITDLVTDTSPAAQALGCTMRASLDLVGEMVVNAAGETRFMRGVGEHPTIGDAAHLIGERELGLIFGAGGAGTLAIGTLHQAPSIPALVKVDELISKHFAVLGTTGVGKSSGVAVLLHGILDARPDLRVFLLDGHNEYAGCFGDRANVLHPRNLRLPFWLFNFEETIDVVYGGRPPIPEEIEILAELIPLAKAAYGQYKSSSDRAGRKRVDGRASGYTVDTPVPYLIQDLLGLLDDRMGRLDNRSSRMHYHRLMTRIETMRNDPRFAFMFENANVGGDIMGDLLVQLFRLDPGGRPMTIMQLAGLPAEVMDAVVCVLCRLAFEFGLWSEGAVPLLFVCEEAHRYASADPTVGFNPTRRALARIAKEGRKYGVFLGLVTQRPAELDPTIISQCSTLFAMRLANDRDQALLRSAVSDAAANLMAFVPSLGTREVIAFGEGVPLPARITFRHLPDAMLPRSDSLRPQAEGDHRSFVQTVVERWRGSTMSHRKTEEASDGLPPAASAPEMAAQAVAPTTLADAAPAPASSPGISAGALDQARYRILKRPIGSGEQPLFSGPAPTDLSLRRR